MSRNLLIALGALVVVVLGGVFVVMPMVLDDGDEVADDQPDELAEGPDAEGPDAEGPDAEDPDAEGLEEDGDDLEIDEVQPSDEDDDFLADKPDDPDEFDERDEASPEDDGPLEETFEVFSARDPFQQLAAESEALPAADGTGDGDPGDDGGGDPGDSDDSDDEDRDDGDDPPSDVTVGGTVIQIESVYTDDEGEDRVELTVNGSGYTLTEGVTAADGALEILAIDPPCVEWQFAEYAPTTLCEGEEITK
ncbi:hypothetical protein ER308_19420 [Egibacter rhizosphaerae]|uniref:Uncharacterized protein n=1 Tax=Egibacter rhizosphaerae TaxID=1670831 RepID=A0A411YK06_9ACTN|nr:hypothetical protein [Egibacter rhizosphaerae]QBI21525.1 hypothetical protein ER308_19420 [Egibacter rhizosphaerae]